MHEMKILLFLLTITSAQLPIPKFQLTPEGVKVTIQGNGYDRAAIHYNINKPLPNIASADNSKDFDAKDLQGRNEWTWTKNVTAHKGDTINYWIWGERNGNGEQLVNRSTILHSLETTAKTTQSVVTSLKISTADPTPSSKFTTTVSADTYTALQNSTSLSSATIAKQNTTTPIVTNTLNFGVTETTATPQHFDTKPQMSYTTVQSNVTSFNVALNENTTTAINSETTFVKSSEKRNKTLSGGHSSTNGTSLNSSFVENMTHNFLTGNNESNNVFTGNGSIHTSNSSIIKESVVGHETFGRLNGVLDSCCGKGYNCKSFPCLIFEDNFDTLNHCIWEHEITAGGNGNSEFQYYTNNRTNSYARNGTLFIKPTLTSDHYGESFLTTGTLDLWGGFNGDTCTSNAFSGCKRTGSIAHPINPVKSARLRSKRGFSFRYGKVEVEAKLPKGDWLWPAIKMLPKWNAYGQWPSSGEIDIVEARGNENYKDLNGVDKGVGSIRSSLHFGPDPKHDGFHKTEVEKILASGTFADSFHKFAVVWDENKISFTVDNLEIKTVQPPNGGFWELGDFDSTTKGLTNPWHKQNGGTQITPFDQEFYLVFDVAVGGTTFFPDSWMNFPYPKPWRDASDFVIRDFWQARHLWYPTWKPDRNNGEDAALQINYVKVWKLKP